MRISTRLCVLMLGLACAGCVLNSWHTETFFDELTYPAADAAAAVKDEKLIIGFIPSLGFKRDEHAAGRPETEAMFIRSDTDHFHITITVRSLARVDKPGFVTIVHVDSYNIGEEGAIAAGKSILNEIDQLYQRETNRKSNGGFGVLGRVAPDTAPAP